MKGQQPLADAGPAPAVDGGTPSRQAELSPRFRRKGEEPAELRGETRPLEARELAQLGRIGRFETRGDLRKPRMTRDERRHPGGGRLGGDHAERLRKDRRDDGDVDERKPMHEMPELERPGEGRPPGSIALELL